MGLESLAIELLIARVQRALAFLKSLFMRRSDDSPSGNCSPFPADSGLPVANPRRYIAQG